MRARRTIPAGSSAVASGAMAVERLDAWLGSPAVRTHHRRAARATPEALWDCAMAVRLDETRSLGRRVRWRIPGLPAELTYHELFRAYPFTVLEEADGMLLAASSGAPITIWELGRFAAGR